MQATSSTSPDILIITRLSHLTQNYISSQSVLKNGWSLTEFEQLSRAWRVRWQTDWVNRAMRHIQGERDEPLADVDICVATLMKTWELREGKGVEEQSQRT